ncbi:MAG TPA: DUF6491 family protein [Rhizomicrobium sp.]|nr:DUF6491 family protein [Rhizomicrobium sp.]
MRITLFALFALGMLSARAQAMTPDKSPAVCLRQNMVWGWKVVDDKTLIVTDKVQKTYKVSLKPGCFDLKWPMRLGFKSFGGFGLSCLARNDYVVVPPEAGMPAQRCLISDVAAFSPTPLPQK